MSQDKFVIDKRFTTQVARSQRVIEVAEAFGLGLDDQEFIVFDNLELTVPQGSVVYITGQSGSGKSLLLRELAVQLENRGKRVINIDQVSLDPDKTLVDQIGKDTNDALRLLSIAGLNDAYLFIRKPQELSDGQRYRFRLAKAIETGAEVWVADEFLAVLDRTAAKVIAYSIQKTARKVGATVVVATTHTDMVPDLAPSLFITKTYREKIRVQKAEEIASVDQLHRNAVAQLLLETI
jgi:hypothetical protein